MAGLNLGPTLNQSKARFRTGPYLKPEQSSVQDRPIFETRAKLGSGQAHI